MNIAKHKYDGTKQPFEFNQKDFTIKVKNELSSIFLDFKNIDPNGKTIKEIGTLLNNLRISNSDSLENLEEMGYARESDYEHYLEQSTKINRALEILGLNSQLIHFDDSGEKFQIQNGKIICKNILRMIELSLGLGLTGSDLEKAKKELDNLLIKNAKELDKLLDNPGLKVPGYREAKILEQSLINQAKEILGL